MMVASTARLSHRHHVGERETTGHWNSVFVVGVTPVAPSLSLYSLIKHCAQADNLTEQT